MACKTVSAGVQVCWFYNDKMIQFPNHSVHASSCYNWMINTLQLQVVTSCVYVDSWFSLYAYSTVVVLYWLFFLSLSRLLIGQSFSMAGFWYLLTLRWSHYRPWWQWSKVTYKDGTRSFLPYILLSQEQSNARERECRKGIRKLCENDQEVMSWIWYGWSCWIL